MRTHEKALILLAVAAVLTFVGYRLLLAGEDGLRPVPLADVRTSPEPQQVSAAVGRLQVPDGDRADLLIDSAGRTLHRYEGDRKGGRPACSGRCAEKWRPLLTEGKPLALTGVPGERLGTVRLADGAEQVTFDGWPLYRSVQELPGTGGKTADDGAWHRIELD